MSAEHSTNGESEAPQVDHQNANAVAGSVEIATNEDINDVIVEDRHEVHCNANLALWVSVLVQGWEYHTVDHIEQLQMPEARAGKSLAITFSSGLQLDWL